MNAKWKAILGKVAPTLGFALGGPMGAAAAKVVSSSLLGREDGTEDELAAAVAGATPDQLATLKKADQDFKVRMRELDIDVYKLEVEDRTSARGLFSVNFLPQMVISGLFIVGYFSVVGLLAAGVIVLSPEIKDLVEDLLKTLSAAVLAIIYFWFGSSFGSKEKTAALAASRPAEGA